MGRQSRSLSQRKRNKSKMGGVDRGSTKHKAGRNAARISAPKLAKSRGERFPSPGLFKRDYSVRYGNNYKRLCASAHTKLKKHGSKCCCCLKRRFQELHHTSYGGSRLGDNWFPVCKKCHTELCHSPKNWIVDRRNPVWGNKNTPEFLRRLLLGYKLIYD